MNQRPLLFFVFLIVGFAFLSCEKEQPTKPPALNFKIGADYTNDGDTIAVGYRLFFGVQARSDESYLTNFTIKKRLQDGTMITMMDTAMYAKYMDIDKVFYQNVEPQATWVFSVMDRERMTAEISMVLNKDPDSQFGGIYYFPSIKLGYQNNTEFGNFLNPSTGEVYRTDSAYLFQSELDILCYFKNDDNPPGPALSSPGEMDNFSTDAQTFYPTITTWDTRNYTLWDISVDTNPMTEQDFDTAQNDSLLIVSYNSVWGRKKFKWATAGKIIPFQTAAGKLGLVKVIHNDDSDIGIMEIAIKIQQ